MARIKAGVQTRKRHKKVLKKAKGYRGARSRHFKAAKENVMRAERYAYRGRKERKRSFRTLWIMRINAAVRQYGLIYSDFMRALAQAKIKLDRKSLANMVIKDPEGFAKIVELAKANIAQAAGSRG